MIIKSDISKLIICLAICLAAGGIGSIFTAPAIPTWYAGLTRPVFTPPNAVFGPVWTTLYILMGVSLYLVIRKGIGNGVVRHALWFFGCQLFLNALWSPVFFGVKSILGGLLIIIALWIFIILTIRVLYSIDRRAAYLLLPYFLWVSYASVLNFELWRLNA